MTNLNLNAHILECRASQAQSEFYVADVVPRRTGVIDPASSLVFGQRGDGGIGQVVHGFGGSGVGTTHVPPGLRPTMESHVHSVTGHGRSVS